MLGTINPEILFLQQEDQIKAGLLDMKMILKITEDTYKMLGQGQIQNPPKVHLGIPEGTEWESFFNTMPSYIGGDLNIAGIKWAAESKKNATTPGIPYGIDISILSDPVTVLPFCIQDGTIITAMRTSAVAGLQAKYCAPSDTDTATLIGAGVIGRTMIMAICEAIPTVKTIYLCDLDLRQQDGSGKVSADRGRDHRQNALHRQELGEAPQRHRLRLQRGHDGRGKGCGRECGGLLEADHHLQEQGHHAGVRRR